MKTPNQIKTALECCRGTYCPKECPYYDECKIGSDAVITDFKQYVQMLESQVPRWIPVEERLPDKMKHVLVFKRRNDHAIWPIAMWHIEIDWRGEDGWSKTQDNGYFDVTHWMPLPSVPKEASE